MGLRQAEAHAVPRGQRLSNQAETNSATITRCSRRKTHGWGMRPWTTSRYPPRSSRERWLLFFVVLTLPMGQDGPSRHQWASMDGLESQADIATLRTFVAQVRRRQFLGCATPVSAILPAIDGSSRPLTTVAFRPRPIRIVSLTYEPHPAASAPDWRGQRRGSRVCLPLPSHCRRSRFQEWKPWVPARAGASAAARLQAQQGQASWLRQQPHAYCGPSPHTWREPEAHWLREQPRPHWRRAAATAQWP